MPPSQQLSPTASETMLPGYRRRSTPYPSRRHSQSSTSSHRQFIPNTTNTPSPPPFRPLSMQDLFERSNNHYEDIQQALRNNDRALFCYNTFIYVRKTVHNFDLVSQDLHQLASLLFTEGIFHGMAEDLYDLFSILDRNDQNIHRRRRRNHTPSPTPSSENPIKEPTPSPPSTESTNYQTALSQQSNNSGSRENPIILDNDHVSYIESPLGSIHNPILIEDSDDEDDYPQGFRYPSPAETRAVPASQVRCQRCGLFGHLRPDCDTALRRLDGMIPHCVRCESDGHYAPECLVTHCRHCDGLDHTIVRCPELQE